MAPRNPKIAIVDYGLGNLFSIERACQHAGMKATLTGRGADLQAAEAVLLPGVGAFADAMEALRERQLIQPLKDLAGDGKPLIGICLGLQLMMSESHEFGVHAGLGLIEGTVERLPEDGMARPGAKRLKIPQVGWNRIQGLTPGEWDGSILAGLEDGAYMYFVHSYYARPRDPGVVLSRTRYGEHDFCSSLRQGNIVACQFHPERSGPDGLRVYHNLRRLLSEGELK